MTNLKISFQLPKTKLINPAKLQKAANEAARSLGLYAQSQLTMMAQAKLRSTTQTFTRGIATKTTGNEFELSLHGELPVALERGAKPWDMKKMLHGRPYVDVPLQRRAPGSGGTLGGIPIPKADYKKILKAQKSGAAYGPRGLGTPLPGTATPQSSSMKLPAKGTGGYVVFRRMTPNSTGWTHPGFRALRFFPAVAKELRKIAPKLLADHLKRAMEGK